jgi:hypothetical protein
LNLENRGQRYEFFSEEEFFGEDFLKFGGIKVVFWGGRGENRVFGA